MFRSGNKRYDIYSSYILTHSRRDLTPWIVLQCIGNDQITLQWFSSFLSQSSHTVLHRKSYIHTSFYHTWRTLMERSISVRHWSSVIYITALLDIFKKYPDTGIHMCDSLMCTYAYGIQWYCHPMNLIVNITNINNYIKDIYTWLTNNSIYLNYHKTTTYIIMSWYC